MGTRDEPVCLGYNLVLWIIKGLGENGKSKLQQTWLWWDTMWWDSVWTESGIWLLLYIEVGKEIKAIAWIKERVLWNSQASNPNQRRSYNVMMVLHKRRRRRRTKKRKKRIWNEGAEAIVLVITKQAKNIWQKLRIVGNLWKTCSSIEELNLARPLRCLKNVTL